MRNIFLKQEHTLYFSCFEKYFLKTNHHFIVLRNILLKQKHDLSHSKKYFLILMTLS